MGSRSPGSRCPLLPLGRESRSVSAAVRSRRRSRPLTGSLWSCSASPKGSRRAPRFGCRSNEKAGRRSAPPKAQSSSSGSDGDEVRQLRRQRVLRRRAHQLFDDFPALKEQKRRDRADAVLGRERLLVVHVDLHDLRPSLEITRQLLERRSDHATRSAPLGPKIHEDWLIGFQHLSLEVLLGADYVLCVTHYPGLLSSYRSSV